MFLNKVRTAPRYFCTISKPHDFIPTSIVVASVEVAIVVVVVVVAVV